MEDYRIVRKNVGVWPFTVYDIEKYYTKRNRGCDGETREKGWQILPKCQFEVHRYITFAEAENALKIMKSKALKIAEAPIVMMEESF